MSVTVQTKLQHFFKSFAKRTYGRNQIIIASGARPTGVFYITSGNVRQYLTAENGGRLTVNIYKPGAFFPMSWALNSAPNDYTYEAIGKVEVREAPVEEVLFFLHQNLDVMFDLLQRVYSGIDGLLQQMTYNATSDTKHKVMASLIMAAKRFGDGDGKRVKISQKFTHQELAMLAGTSRESVTRTLKLLVGQKLLEIDNREMTLPDMPQLERLLET